MPLEFAPASHGIAYKVVSTNPVDRYSGTLVSALVRTSPYRQNYRQNAWYHTPEFGPVICFADEGAAQVWAHNYNARHPNNYNALTIFTLPFYADRVHPVAKVLKMEGRWYENCKAFWQADIEGKSLAGFVTRDAPAGSIGIFGVYTLGFPVGLWPSHQINAYLNPPKAD